MTDEFANENTLWQLQFSVAVEHSCLEVSFIAVSTPSQLALSLKLSIAPKSFVNNFGANRKDSESVFDWRYSHGNGYQVRQFNGGNLILK